jgi:lipopolysaccharide export system protein LptC
MLQEFDDLCIKILSATSPGQSYRLRPLQSEDLEVVSKHDNLASNQKGQYTRLNRHDQAKRLTSKHKSASMVLERELANRKLRPVRGFSEPGAPILN